MSRKHNVKKTGSRSRYKERLQSRGLSGTPRMPWSHCDGLMSTDQIAKALREAQARRQRGGS